MKKSIITILAIVAIVGLFHQHEQNISSFLNKNNEGEYINKMQTTSTITNNSSNTILEDLSKREFFKQYHKDEQDDENGQIRLKQQGVPNALTYNINTKIFVNQTANGHGNTDPVSDIRIEANADVQTVYNAQSDVYEIAISYNQFFKSYGVMKTLRSQQPNQDQEEQDIQYKEQENIDNIKLQGMDDFQKYGDVQVVNGQEAVQGSIDKGTFKVDEKKDRFFKVYVNGSSGIIQAIQAESGFDEDFLHTWVTEQFVSDIFPDLRQSSYNKRVSQNDNLGIIEAKYTQSPLQNGHLNIRREYTQEDYSSHYVQDVTLPSQNYRRDVQLNKQLGIVESGNSVYKFQHGQDQFFNQAALDGNRDPDQLGKVEGYIKQSFQRVNTDQQQNVKSEMWRYRNQADFHFTDLKDSFKASFQVGDGQKERDIETVDFLEDDRQVTVDEGEPDYFYFYKGQISYLNQEQQTKQENLNEEEIKLQQQGRYAGRYTGKGQNDNSDYHCQIGWNCNQNNNNDNNIDRNQSYEQRREEEHWRSMRRRRMNQVRRQKNKSDQMFNQHKSRPKKNNLNVQARSAQQDIIRSDHKYENQETFYRHQDTLTDVKVFGSHIHLDFDYIAQQDTSSVRFDLMVNSHVVDNLFSVTWKNCKSSDIKNQQHSKSLMLFKATFPLLGIITIPVQVKAKIDYGYQGSVNGGPRQCGFDFTPTFIGDLYADGQASILNIISAGIYSSGQFINSSLMFSIGTNNGQSYTSLKGDFVGIVLDIGATYTKINCHMKRIMKKLQQDDNNTEEFQTEFSLQQDGSNNDIQFKGNRRSLRWGIGRKVKRLVKRVVRNTVKTAKKVKKVVKRVEKAVEFEIKKICSVKKGFKQIYKKRTKTHSRYIFNTRLNFGL